MSLLFSSLSVSPAAHKDSLSSAYLSKSKGVLDTFAENVYATSSFRALVYSPLTLLLDTFLMGILNVALLIVSSSVKPKQRKRYAIIFSPAAVLNTTFLSAGLANVPALVS